MVVSIHRDLYYCTSQVLEGCDYHRHTNCNGFAVTLGSTVLMNVTLTPMIVATFPILIGLGVDYALHMVNRIDEPEEKK